MSEFKAENTDIALAMASISNEEIGYFLMKIGLI